MLGGTGAVVAMQGRRLGLSPCRWPSQQRRAFGAAARPAQHPPSTRMICAGTWGNKWMWWQTSLLLSGITERRWCLWEHGPCHIPFSAQGTHRLGKGRSGRWMTGSMGRSWQRKAWLATRSWQHPSGSRLGAHHQQHVPPLPPLPSAAPGTWQSRAGVRRSGATPTPAAW